MAALGVALLIASSAGCGTRVTSAQASSTCVHAAKFLAGAPPFSALPSAIYRPPVPAGLGDVRARVLPPAPADAVLRPGDSFVAVPYPGAVRLVVIGTTGQSSVTSSLQEVRQAITARGWTATTVSLTHSGGQLTDFEVSFRGGGHTGVESTLHCPGEPDRLVVQGPPDVVGGDGPTCVTFGSALPLTMSSFRESDCT